MWAIGVSMKKKLFGVGVNDAGDTVVKNAIDPKTGRRRIVWICPYYATWASMIKRCYSKNTHATRPSYVGCFVCDDWHNFSSFKGWMETQDWQNKSLDKDLLCPGNKRYGPSECLFISKTINSFLTDSAASRGQYPIGVYRRSRQNGKFVAQCRNPFTGKGEYLGEFATAEAAHQAWLQRKREHAARLANEQTDSKVAQALLSRY